MTFYPHGHPSFFRKFDYVQDRIVAYRWYHGSEMNFAVFGVYLALIFTFVSGRLMNYWFILGHVDEISSQL